MNPQTRHPCRAALASIPSASRRLRALLGWVLVWAGLIGFGVVLFAVHRPRTPEPTTTPVTVQFGQTVLECTWYEDRANHLRSLSC